MHLPTEADALEFTGGDTTFSDGLPGTLDSALPPVGWVLFRPAGVRMRNRMLSGGCGQDGTIGPADQGLGSAGAQIDSQVGAHERLQLQDDGIIIGYGSLKRKRGVACNRKVHPR